MSNGWLLALFLGGIAYYVVVLRRFNSLGFRIFSVTTFLVIAGMMVITRDHAQARRLVAQGDVVFATVEQVHADAASPHLLVAYAGASHRLSDAISRQEFAAFRSGQRIELLRDPVSGQLFVKQSYQRMLSQYWIIYLVTSVFFVLGCLSWYFLRHLKIGVDDEGHEWLENPQGEVVLDERNNPNAQVLKRANLLVKLWQWFR